MNSWEYPLCHSEDLFEESCVSHVRVVHVFTVHVLVEPVFVLLLHVLVVLHVFVSLLLLLLHPHHPLFDDFFFQFAINVMSHVIGVEKSNALFSLSHDKYRCRNLYHHLVGSDGAVIISLYFHVIGAIVSFHQFTSKLTVTTFIHFA